ncbi:hypothetical protein QN277_018020 [Acacia crassicarpa]|uniref:CCT domain-containing protein n=1 Tax=Acacia crassicarpa TaxID=499986 RepID=A0AAE1MNS7_9FABA|nr:hypothetical protein QN277_018020 [Acacia crassicarpa]
MEYNSVLRSPKKEEQQVPDATTYSSEDFNILDELGDGVLGSEHDHSKSQHHCHGGYLNWDFMEMEGFSTVDAEEAEVANDDEGEEQEEEEERSKCRLVEKDKIIKTEKNGGGLWEEDDDDEKMASLKLNLNHQEVLDAWSDRGSLWAHDSSLSMPSNANDAFFYMGEVPILQEEDRSRRNASVRRYKEKRQSRLFSKKIRYEVRKLNADKRPRLKGRFVKKRL